jgi:hypothetical protein
MLFLIGLRPDGEPVGRIWLSVEHPKGTADSRLPLRHRGRRAAPGQGLRAGPADGGRRIGTIRGVSALELNVFGGNATSIGLYESAGYVVVQQQMRTRLT